jgi:hypothetical protein
MTISSTAGSASLGGISSYSGSIAFAEVKLRSNGESFINYLTFFRFSMAGGSSRKHIAARLDRVQV